MATATMDKVKVTKVWIRRAEGPTRLCGEYEYEGENAMARAQAKMQEWGRTAPEGGGYDKCDFRVTFADGEVYEGRYDLVRGGRNDSDDTILGQMSRMLRYLAGEYRPAWMKDEIWEQVCRNHETTGSAAQAKEWLAKYELAS